MREGIVEQILQLQRQYFEYLQQEQAPAFMAVELTMPQLKALLVAASAQGATGGQLARGLGVSQSTVTGIVDRLCEHGLVQRSEDPDDRRITRVAPTSEGRELVERLYRYRREHLSQLLDRLDAPQLETVERALSFLVEAASAGSHDSEPAETVLASSAPPATMGE